MGNVNMCKEAPLPAEIPTKTKNQAVAGSGGALDLPPNCKVRVCVVAFDYHGYGADAQQHPRLSAVRDGVRFARMAKDCGAEVREFYDRKDLAKKEHRVSHGFVSDGFPSKQAILDEWKRVGALMTADDAFVFYFTGHGISRPREVEEGNEEMMTFMEPNGSPSHLTETEVVNAITDAFPPNSHVLFITDCFYNSNLCDLSRPAFSGRPIVHLAAVKDHRHMPAAPKGKAVMKDQPGQFTQALLETLEKLVERPIMGDASQTHTDLPGLEKVALRTRKSVGVANAMAKRLDELAHGRHQEISVVEVYNKVLEASNARAENQDEPTVDLSKQEMVFGTPKEEGSPASCASQSPGKSENPDFFFERTAQFDPDTFRWPLVPPTDWHFSDPLIPSQKESGLSAYSCMKA